jgi:hypothetical protein
MRTGCEDVELAGQRLPAPAGSGSRQDSFFELLARDPRRFRILGSYVAGSLAAGAMLATAAKNRIEGLQRLNVQLERLNVQLDDGHGTEQRANVLIDLLDVSLPRGHFDI